MANSVTLTKGAGGLGTPLTSTDHISGLISLTNELPSGFSTASRIQQVYSVAEAETLGITSTFSVGDTWTASSTDILHYHIEEYFRIQPKGNLYVGIYATSSDFAEITEMVDYANGEIKQIGIYDYTTYTSGNVSLIQAQLDLCETNNKPLVALYQPSFIGVTTSLSTLTTIHDQTNEGVSVLLGQDGGNLGKSLYDATTKTIGCVGTVLGAVSLSKVNESLAWINKYDLSATEYDTLAFGNGTQYASLSDNTINGIDGKGYLFLKKHVGIAGSYINNPYTAVALTSDYKYIHRNRTINKAIRNLRTFILPELARPLTFNSDGTLSEDIISYFETIGARALDQMIRDSEISNYSVYIDSSQNTLSTGELEINVMIIPVGTADVIKVNVGFVTSL
jgi:hypothetical protein